MLTPEDVKTKQETLQAINEQAVKEILQAIDQDSDQIIIDAIREGTFNSKGGEINFPNLGIMLTQPQVGILSRAVVKFFKAHNWIVDRIQVDKGGIQEGRTTIKSASMKVKLVADYKKPVP